MWFFTCIGGGRETRAVRILIRKRFINGARTHACPIRVHKSWSHPTLPRPAPNRTCFVNISRVPDSRNLPYDGASFSLGTIRETIAWIGGRKAGREKRSDWPRVRETHSERFNAGPHLGYLHYVNAQVLHYVSAPRAQALNNVNVACATRSAGP